MNVDSPLAFTIIGFDPFNALVWISLIEIPLE